MERIEQVCSVTRLLLGVTAAFLLMSFTTADAEMTICAENFDSRPLGDSVDESVAGLIGDGGGTQAAGVRANVLPSG